MSVSQVKWLSRWPRVNPQNKFVVFLFQQIRSPLSVVLFPHLQADGSLTFLSGVICTTEHLVFQPLFTLLSHLCPLPLHLRFLYCGQLSLCEQPISSKFRNQHGKQNRHKCRSNLFVRLPSCSIIAFRKPPETMKSEKNTANRAPSVCLIVCFCFSSKSSNRGFLKKGGLDNWSF